MLVHILPSFIDSLYSSLILIILLVFLSLPLPLVPLGPSFALADDAVVGEDDEVMSVDDEEGEDDENVVLPDSGEARVRY